MLALRHITKRFGDTLALDDVSLDIGPGERLGLVGENGAGKSSLMNVLYGLYRPDSGTVRFDDREVRLLSPLDALARGVGMVHQHFTLVPNLTVAENVVLGDEPRKRGLIDRDAAREVVKRTCARLNFRLDPDARVDTLTVGGQQKVEIVKALRRGATTLILDEPTAVLTPQEVDELYGVTRALSDSGATVVLITHKLTEVLAFATRIAVMRRGRKVAEVAPAQTSATELAALMVGEEHVARLTAPPTAGHPATRPPTPDSPPAPVVELDHVHAERLSDLTFSLQPGEIVGIAGVDGNGQRELAEVLTGLRPITQGQLRLLGQRVPRLHPHLARQLRVAHVPEDRLKRALVLDFTLEENIALGRQRQPPFAQGPLIDFAGRRTRTQSLLSAHDVRPAEPTLRAAALSGGNQQKLVVARELDGEPKLLVVVQPTRGLDVHAVAAVQERLLAEAKKGCGIVLVSLDLDEVLSLADRVLVMFEGRFNGEFASGPKADRQLIGRHMLGAARA